MSQTWWGALVGAGMGLGVWLLLRWGAARRRPDFRQRVLTYVRDTPELSAPRDRADVGAVRLLFEPILQSAAGRLDAVLGGSVSVRRRIERAGLDLTLHDFRVQQVVWGLAAFGVSAAMTLVVATRSPERTVPMLVLSALAFVLGVLLRENRLTSQARSYERRVLEEMPALAELLALAVAAGEGPVAALDRVVSRSCGALSADLGRVLAEIRTGVPVGVAFDAYAARTGLPVVARFAQGIAVAVERGTPLADVLHAQAADVRESQRRALIESGARREVLMMVPVVFLVMPTTVLFAFWPGVVGLDLVTP